MTDLLEALMILCFGLSWPISIRKSWISKTAKGKSLFFEFFIWIGYVFGIARKLMLWSDANAAGTQLEWLFYLGGFFYVLNIVEISIDMALYFRNVKLDKARDAEA
ncbi:MAG: hypothetical protein EOM40_03180 [Clostridia bacterium]|nr:hypothetical protein [Clostridia bacterium]NCC44084.1 hypothetical protein [Clostridia bacterium]